MRRPYFTDWEDVMKKYILALDEGTTSTRAILFDRAGEIVSTAQREFPSQYPQPGWVEQDAQEIYAAQYATLTESLVRCGAEMQEVAAIGITNQRETVVVWDRHTGKPLCPAIVWQCRRTADVCRKLVEDGLSPMIAEKTGLRPDAYFSATKLAWILDHVDGARAAAEAGDALFGTIDTWLLWKLSGGVLHKTDATNASRTMLYNIHTQDWDEDLLKLFHIPRAMLPQVCPSGSFFGDVHILGTTVPVCAMAGDQQAALFGQGCFAPGEGKNTYGTGCFLLVNCGSQAVQSKSGMLTTVAATLTGEDPQYALEGSVFVGGAVIQWLRDAMGLITEARDSAYFASKVKDNEGVYLVPAFTGLGAPHWDMYARGTLVGMTRASGRNHIIRAALESIAYQTEDILQAISADAGMEMRDLKVDGGASANDLLMQFQSDISHVRVIRPASAEATARGAAYLAGLSCGFWQSREDLPLMADSKSYSPVMEESERSRLLNGWHRAVRAARAWAEE